MIDWWPRRSGHLRALLQVLRMARAANSMLCLKCCIWLGVAISMLLFASAANGSNQPV
jgi:hypothetical protein